MDDRSGGEPEPRVAVPPPEPVAARIEGVDEGSSDERTIAGVVAVRGLPAISSDGRLVALVHEEGAGNWERDSLRVLRAADASEERSYPLFEISAEDDHDEASWRARLREVRRLGARADRFLRRRGFRSLPRLPREDEPPVRGLPVLELGPDRSEGTVVIRDAASGRIRLRRALHPFFLPGGAPPDESDPETGYVNPCSRPELADVDAWMLPDGRVLVRSTVNPPADVCRVSNHYDIVALD